jgi:nicotinamide-nucleotide amidase
VHIETICTGDELLTGLTSDTNSRFFQQQLLDRTGLTVRRGQVVGDDRADIIEALNLAAARADVVLVSGGLGPTADDLTAECAATAAGVPLVESPEALQHLVKRFEARGIQLTENNRRQALVPQGTEVVLNAEGTAPMFIQRRGATTFFYVPGVPREYRHLVETVVVPRIAQLKGGLPPRKLALLKTVGLPESHLDQRVKPLAAKYTDVVFGFRTHPPENHLKLLATGADADRRLEEVVAEARGVLGETYFGRDDETLAGVVLKQLESKKQKLVCAESVTGGLIAERFTAEPGASEVFFGGVCSYTEDAKILWADVPPGLLGQFGAVSRETCEAMAAGIRARTGADWAVSSTGWAGPTGGDAENPVGTVYLGVAGPDGVTVEKHRFHGDRERVRSFAAATALDLLRKRLEGTTS